IDMDGKIAHRIELEVARDDAMLAAVELEIVDAGEKPARIDLLPQIRVVERNVDGRLAVAVDDAGHAAFATHRPSGPLTGPRARRRLDFLDGRHVESSCSIAIANGRLRGRSARPASRGATYPRCRGV